MRRRFGVVVCLIIISLYSTCCSNPVAPSTPLHVTPATIETTVNTTVFFDAKGGNGTYIWTLVSGLGEPKTGRGSSFAFTPREKGSFKISLVSGDQQVFVGGAAR